jgi:hypothetical protein
MINRKAGSRIDSVEKELALSIGDPSSVDEAALHLVRATLARERPAELPLLESHGSELLAQVRASRMTKRGDDPLAFGADGSIALLTPVLLAVGAKAVEFLYDVLTSAASDALKERILAWRRGKASLTLPDDVEERMREVLEAELAHRYPAVDTAGVTEKLLAALKA